MRRIVSVEAALVLLAVLILLAPWTTPRAEAEPMRWQAYEVAIWQASERGWYGRPQLLLDPNVAEVAQRQADRMAATGSLHHQDLGCFLSWGWQAAGENVGRGPTTWSAHEAMSYSPAHLANALDSRWSRFGVGAAYSHDGTAYVSVVFIG